MGLVGSLGAGVVARGEAVLPSAAVMGSVVDCSSVAVGGSVGGNSPTILIYVM